MPPRAEHIKIINIFVKNPPTEKLFTKISPKISVNKNIIPPQARPVLMPFLPRLFAAAAPAEKHPAHSAKLDITVKVPSLRSIADAIAENSTLAVKIAPTNASTVQITRIIRSFRRCSAALFRRILTPPVTNSFSKDYSGSRENIRVLRSG